MVVVPKSKVSMLSACKNENYHHHSLKIIRVVFRFLVSVEKLLKAINCAKNQINSTLITSSWVHIHIKSFEYKIHTSKAKIKVMHIITQKNPK